MAVIQSIRAKPPAATPWTIWAMVPFPRGTDLTKIAVLDSDGTPRWAQVTERARDCKWHHCVVAAALTGTRSDELYSVTNDVVSAPVGTGLFDEAAFNLLHNPTSGNRWTLRITRGDLTTADFLITTGTTTYLELGPVRRVALWETDLGEWGHMSFWLRLHAHSTRLYPEILWQNGALPAKADCYFRSALWVGPASHNWAKAWPETLSSGNAFVTAPPANQHAILQRYGRPFYHVIKPAAEPFPADLDPWNGWGAADYTKGGFLVYDVPLPDAATFRASAEACQAARWTGVRDALAGNVQPPLWSFAPAPPSPMWPTEGETGGGATGGNGMAHYAGHLAAMTGMKEGVGQMAIHSLREWCRMRHAWLTESTGEVVNSNSYLAGDQSTPWEIFNCEFLNGRDSPFDFDQTGAGIGGPCDYESSLLTWAPIDEQHYTRVAQYDIALFALTGSRMSQRCVEMLAEISRMAHYETTGFSARANFSWGVGKGSGGGRADAFYSRPMALSWAIRFGDSVWRVRWKPWVQKWFSVFISSQMPNGMNWTNNAGKAQTDPPLDSDNDGDNDFWGQIALEEQYLMMSMRAWNVVVEDADLPTDVTRTAIKKFLHNQALSQWRYFWRPGTGGVWFIVPHGPNDGSLFRYTAQSEWPVTNDWSIGNFTDAFHVQNCIAHASEFGHDPEWRASVMANLGVADLAAGYSALLAGFFNTNNVDQDNNAIHLLTVLQKHRTVL